MNYLCSDIVIIDSGIGGLTVLNHFYMHYNHCNITYCADNRFFPFGTKSDEELIFIVDRLIRYFESQNFKIIFLACNSASVIYNKYLKNKYNICVYTIIDETVYDLISQGPFNRVGIIGTNQTINSNVYQEAIKKKLAVEVHAFACSTLVLLCEQYRENEIKEYIETYFQIFKSYDALVLGCTHFNTIEGLFNDFFNDRVKLICSGYHAIRNLHSTLIKYKDVQRIFLTKTNPDYEMKIKCLFPHLKNIEVVTLKI